MKITFLQKLAIAFSATIAVTSGILFACADGGDWGIFYQTNYTPETFVDSSYSPLFLSSDVFYNPEPMNNNEDIFNDVIVADWQNYLGEAIDKKHLSFFLLDSSAVDVAKIYNYYTTKKENAFSQKWSKKINLQNDNVKQFFEFLYLAQQVEKASIANNGSWNYDDYKRPYINNEKFLKLLEKKYTTTTDVFLKNRYWFQTIKAYFYSNFRKDGLIFFYSTQNAVPKNTLYYRALSYAAGIHYKQKEYAKSNYQYSIVFDQCKPLQMVASYNFHPQNEKDWQQSLAMAKNNQEKEALWAISGYYGDETKAVENIYALNPKSEYLDYLLSRIINIAEQKIDNSFKDKSLAIYKNKAKDSIVKSNIAIVFTIANDQKTNKPYMWNMAAGYLETLQGNYANAQKMFDKTDKSMPKTELAQNQLRLLRFINNLSAIETITTKEEAILNPDLNWLYNQLPKKETTAFRFQNAISWSQNYLSALFHAKNNVVMEELFDRDANFYSDKNRLEAMKTFLSKTNKTEFEKIATNVYSVKLDDVYEYQAVLATYDNKIDDAIGFMKQTDSIKNTQFYGNPFNGKIKDCHDCDHFAKQSKKYSYLDFLNLIKDMQQKVAKNEDNYNNCILLGNAFYNITYYGNARIFYQGNIMQQGEYASYDDSNNKDLYKFMTDCSKAYQYYQLAFEHAKTDEERAKAQYMMAKCQRNDWYNNRYEDVTDGWKMYDEKINFIAWNGFKTLKKDYSNTKYYQEILAECGYFKTYATNKKK